MDDELVLNLVSGDRLASKNSSQPKSKGGRWTDRLQARKGTKRKERHGENEQSSSTAALSSSSRPVKQQKRMHSDHTEFVSLRTEKESSSHPRPGGTVISSLFSSNPAVPQQSNSRPAKAPGLPSNAPLKDDSTFSGLGLDPLLVSHLQLKMNVLKPTGIQRAAIPQLISTDESILARDIFLQSQTGSGKTLSFLLPIIHDLLPLSQLSFITRSIGTLAVIIAPTRELAKQISDVLESLLQMRLRSYSETPDDESASQHLTRWLVSGVLTGGATRTHEKARLRKGLPILVSTPGRLLDHLQHTASFDVGKCKWLILDEADRLMELGFEQTIEGILKGLDGRRKLAIQAVEDGTSSDVGGWDWSRPRRTVLCSATIHEEVQRLAGTALRNPIIIKNTSEKSVSRHSELALSHSAKSASPELTIPAQLSQRYVVAPLKLRLVTLVALIRSILVQTAAGNQKILIFLSCTDSVDFHWTLLGKASMHKGSSDPELSDNVSDSASEVDESDGVGMKSPLLPNARIYKLHGSLALKGRQASLKQFLDDACSSVLLCTSVASRGLDMPLVGAVIQYDLPTENGATEYVHRVGRTARAGQGGEAWSFVSPGEMEWVGWLEEKLNSATSPRQIALHGMKFDDVLRKGFGGEGSEYERRATEVQLAFERCVLHNQQYGDSARKAFASHIRAYATHSSEDKHIFHVRKLHLGHLAKAFALRETPASVSQHGKPGRNARRPTKRNSQSTKLGLRKGRNKQGKNTISDYQIASL